MMHLSAFHDVFNGIKAFDHVQRNDLKGFPQHNVVNALCMSG